MGYGHSADPVPNEYTWRCRTCPSTAGRTWTDVDEADRWAAKHDKAAHAGTPTAITTPVR